jgi:hypothetical protein
MKKLSLIAVLAASVLFTGCKQPEPPPSSEPNFSMQYLKGGSLMDIKNGDVIVVDEFNEGAGQVVIDGQLVTSEAFKLEVNVAREYNIPTDGTDDLCIGICKPTNEQTTQIFTFDAVAGENSFNAHLTTAVAGDKKVNYNFHDKTTPDVKLEFSVIYRYNQ